MQYFPFLENKETAAGANKTVLPCSLSLSDCDLEASQPALPSALKVFPVMAWMHLPAAAQSSPEHYTKGLPGVSERLQGLPRGNKE